MAVKKATLAVYSKEAKEMITLCEKQIENDSPVGLSQSLKSLDSAINTLQDLRYLLNLNRYKDE